MVRYLHYVLFWINPENEEIAVLTNLHYTRKGTLHYFAGSSILENFNIAGFGKIPELIEQVATIYENSPALANFQENNPDYNNMTRRELAKLMVSVMSIAGLQGPLHLGMTAMGFHSYLFIISNSGMFQFPIALNILIASDHFSPESYPNSATPKILIPMLLGRIKCPLQWIKNTDK